MRLTTCLRIWIGEWVYKAKKPTVKQKSLERGSAKHGDSTLFCEAQGVPLGCFVVFIGNPESNLLSNVQLVEYLAN